MQTTLFLRLALAIALLSVLGCGNSNDGSSSTTTGAIASQTPTPGSAEFVRTVVLPEEKTAFAETDRAIYFAGDAGVATLLNTGLDSLFLPGCAPFVFEQSLDGEWAFVGPPFVCVWEGLAIPVERNETDSIEFTAPNESGFYRLRYDYSIGCDAGLPLSQANCDAELVVYSSGFEVVREACDPDHPSCRFIPAAPNILCPDGASVSGPSAECTRDPETWECGYEFLSCP